MEKWVHALTSDVRGGTVISEGRWESENGSHRMCTALDMYGKWRLWTVLHRSVAGVPDCSSSGPRDVKWTSEMHVMKSESHRAILLHQDTVLSETVEYACKYLATMFRFLKDWITFINFVQLKLYEISSVAKPCWPLKEEFLLNHIYIFSPFLAVYFCLGK
jgi:hypothetical protein